MRAGKLELAQAYRESKRFEAARNLLRDLSESDPAVAYQSALLSLAERGAAGQQNAFESLKVFAQDERGLLISLGSAATPPVREDIRRGRAWLYRLGLMMGQQKLRDGDAKGAIYYFKPVADAVSFACPEPSPILCGTAIGGTDQLGTLASEPRPTADQMLNVYFQLGIASLRAAGLQQTLGLGGVSSSMGGVGALDCIGGQIQPDSPFHFDEAAKAFDTFIRRSNQSAASSANAHWGLGCTQLASLRDQRFGADPARLNEAIAHLGQAPQNDALTFVTLARAHILQGQLPLARVNYERALGLLGATRCPQEGTAGASAATWQTPSRIYFEMARMQFAPDSVRQSGLQAAPGDLFDRTIGDVEKAQVEPLRAAERDLQCAVQLDPFKRGSTSDARAHLPEARQQHDAARRV